MNKKSLGRTDLLLWAILLRLMVVSDVPEQLDLVKTIALILYFGSIVLYIIAMMIRE